MRNGLVGIFIFFISSMVCAQPTCDILTPGISSNPSSIMVNQTSDLIFTVYNDAQGGDCCYDVESVLVYVFLPENGGLTYQSVISPAGGTGPYFDWVFDAGANTIIGTNHTAICDGEGEADVTIRIIGSTLPFYPQNRTVGITILNNPDGPPFLSNNEGNDNGLTTLTISAPLPVKLLSFTAVAKECNRVDVQWQTATEINNDYFEVQKSKDGRTFTAMAKIKGSNQVSGSFYQVQDLEVVTGETYFYRLRQVDFDGTETIFEPTIVRTNDCLENTDISVYPNPVMDKLYVNYKGTNPENYERLIITDILGRVIRIINHPFDKKSLEIDVSGLNSGVYNINVEGDLGTSTQKFVKL